MTQPDDIVTHILCDKNFIPKTQGFAFAPVNFALIKYWGKRNAALNLPITSSLSIALPEKGASTFIQCIEGTNDELFFNQQFLDINHLFTQRISSFLDLFRTQD